MQQIHRSGSQDLCGPLAAVPYLRNNILVEFRFMTDKQDTSPIFKKALFQGLFCVHIQMIGRLVKKQHIGFFIDKLAQADFCLFSTAEYTNLAFNVFGGKSAFGQCRTHFILGIGWEFCPDLINAGGLIVALYFLLKVSDLQVVP